MVKTKIWFNLLKGQQFQLTQFTCIGSTDEGMWYSQRNTNLRSTVSRQRNYQESQQMQTTKRD